MGRAHIEQHRCIDGRICASAIKPQAEIVVCVCPSDQGDSALVCAIAADKIARDHAPRHLIGRLAHAQFADLCHVAE